MFEGIIENGRQDDDVGGAVSYSWDDSLYGADDELEDDVLEMEEVVGSRIEQFLRRHERVDRSRTHCWSLWNKSKFTESYTQRFALSEASVEERGSDSVQVPMRWTRRRQLLRGADRADTRYSHHGEKTNVCGEYAWWNAIASECHPADAEHPPSARSDCHPIPRDSAQKSLSFLYTRVAAYLQGAVRRSVCSWKVLSRRHL